MGYGWIFNPPQRRYIDATVNGPMLLIQWLGALLVGGLAYFLAKEPSQRNQHPELVESDHGEPEAAGHLRGPVGVGGWLLLLIVGMMLLGPLLGAARLGTDIWMAEQEYPALSSLNEWATYKKAAWGIFLGAAGISFWGGLGLARDKEWSAVTGAQAVLWITGPASLVVLQGLLPIFIFGHAGTIDAQFVGALLSSIIAAAVWTAYLSKSTRVKNTFGQLTVNDGIGPFCEAGLQSQQTKPDDIAPPAQATSNSWIPLGLILGWLAYFIISAKSPSQGPAPQPQATTPPASQDQNAVTLKNQIEASRPQPVANVAPAIAGQDITTQPGKDASTVSQDISRKLPARYIVLETAPDFLKPGQRVTIYAFSGRWARLTKSEPHQWVELAHIKPAK